PPGSARAGPDERHRSTCAEISVGRRMRLRARDGRVGYGQIARGCAMSKSRELSLVRLAGRALVALTFGALLAADGPGAPQPATAAAPCSTPQFAPHVDFTVPSYAVSVAVGDFNGDGKQDLA